MIKLRQRSSEKRSFVEIPVHVNVKIMSVSPQCVVVSSSKAPFEVQSQCGRLQRLALLQTEHSVDMLECQTLLLRPSQQASSPQQVLDLPTIQHHCCQPIQLIFSKRLRIGRASQELGPDVAAGRFIEVLVDQRHMDPRLEGGIDVLGAVGG